MLEFGMLGKSHLHSPDVRDGDFKPLLTGSGGQGVTMQRMGPGDTEGTEFVGQRNIYTQGLITEKRTT